MPVNKTNHLERLEQRGDPSPKAVSHLSVSVPENHSMPPTQVPLAGVGHVTKLKISQSVAIEKDQKQVVLLVNENSRNR